MHVRWGAAGRSLVVIGVIASGRLAVAAPSRTEQVRTACLRTWMHGMTAEIAQREVGEAGVPALLDLLADPTFPRRDNVVAFLTFLGGDEVTGALEAHLAAPAGDVAAPENDRALLLAPQALGHHAARGQRRALEALMRMTADDDGGVLAGAAGRSAQPARLLGDLQAMAFRGLGLSGDPAGRDRLDAVASGTQPRRDRRLQSAARSALAVAPATDTAPAAAEAGPAPAGRSLDTQPDLHDTLLTYANHVDVADPMTDARLDQVLALSSLKIGRQDFTGDVACCVTFHRGNSGQTFGTSGDGLDVIDTDPEMAAVLGDVSARIKVVRAINWCGGPGTNIIGCGYTPGFGAAVVRWSGNLGGEAVVWIHEYGHNTGLPHASNPRDIMSPSTDGSDDGLTQTECASYHQPSPSAQSFPVDVGVCADSDGDLVHDGIDDCPLDPNTDQTDSDGDGVGDVCETNCGNGVLDPGEQCDDGNRVRDDGCTDHCTICGDGVRTFPEACDDGNLTNGDGCSASCTLECPPAPVAGCRAPLASRKSSLTFKDRTSDTGDSLVWRWSDGPATAKTDFGMPTVGDPLQLCVYDANGLVSKAAVPAAGDCGGRPCWSDVGSGYQYRNRAETPNGVQSVRLTAGLTAGRSRIQVKAKGIHLEVPALAGLASPLRVQLRTAGAACFEATFSAPFVRQDAGELIGKSD